MKTINVNKVVLFLVSTMMFVACGKRQNDVQDAKYYGSGKIIETVSRECVEYDIQCVPLDSTLKAKKAIADFESEASSAVEPVKKDVVKKYLEILGDYTTLDDEGNILYGIDQALFYRFYQECQPDCAPYRYDSYKNTLWVASLRSNDELLPEEVRKQLIELQKQAVDTVFNVLKSKVSKYKDLVGIVDLDAYMKNPYNYVGIERYGEDCRDFYPPETSGNYTLRDGVYYHVKAKADTAKAQQAWKNVNKHNPTKKVMKQRSGYRQR